MSDDHIIAISEKLGKLTGMIETSIENQDKINATTTKILEKHDNELNDVKATKHKLIGAAMFASLFGGSVTTAISKFFVGGN